MAITRHIKKAKKQATKARSAERKEFTTFMEMLLNESGQTIQPYLRSSIRLNGTTMSSFLEFCTEPRLTL